MTTTLLDPPRPAPAATPRRRPATVGLPAPLLDPRGPIRRVLKLVVTGGFGAGKTTFVHTVSQLPPVTCEVSLTEPATASRKLATTSAIDFGRLELRPRGTGREVTVCLFGTPGIGRFWPGLWPAIAGGAAGAVVLVNPLDVAGCFTAIDHCEQRGLPFVVALNLVDGSPAYTPAQIRAALRLDERVPVDSCDVRHQRAATAVLASLVEHALSTRPRATVAIHSG